MAAEVKVTTASIEIRTVKLTKALLKQFRVLTSIPTGWMEEAKILDKYLVGWYKGVVLGDEFGEHTLLTNGQGDYFVYRYVTKETKGQCKQIYIV